MTGLVTLREPVVRPAAPDPEERDPEAVFRAAVRAGWVDGIAAAWAAHAAGLPLARGEGETLLWSIREVRHVIFMRRLVAEGRLAGDDEPDS